MKIEKQIICEQCDLVLDVPVDKGFKVGVCPRCGFVLHHYHPMPIVYSFCYAISALVMLITTDFLPFLSINFSGLSNSMMVLDYTTILNNDDLGVAGWLIFLFMQMFPLVALGCIIICDVSFLLKYRNRFAGKILRLFSFCKDWSMVDVFVVGVLVSLIKLVNLVDVVYESGFWSYIIFALFFLLAISRFHIHIMWDFFFDKVKLTRPIKSGIPAINQNFYLCPVCENIVDKTVYSECPRCGKDITDNSNTSVQRCLAFLIAAMAIYIPANIYPMMITVYMGSGETSTIIEGVIVLWKMGSYFVSGIIFIASICIPILKIIALLYLCFIIKSPKRAKKSRYLGVLFRIVEFIGKWSMVDVFVVAVMVSIVRIGNVMIIEPGVAMISFGSVVILTILAAKQFNPKLLWKSNKFIYGVTVSNG